VGGALASDVNSSAYVYYRSSVDNSAWAVYASGGKWLQASLSTSVAMSNTSFLWLHQTLLYLDLYGQCNILYYPNNQWQTIMLGEGSSELMSSLSGSTSTNLIFAGRSDGHIVCFLYGQPTPAIAQGAVPLQ
jgi:hypothetical protein